MSDTVKVYWEDLEPPGFVDMPPIPDLSYPPTASHSEREGLKDSEFVHFASQVIEPHFGEKTRNLVVVNHQPNHDRLLVFGYDSTCCEWGAGPDVPFPEHPAWASEWKCTQCGSTVYPEILCEIPINADAVPVNKNRLVGNLQHLADYLNAALRNRVVAHMRRLFEEQPEWKAVFTANMEKEWEFLSEWLPTQGGTIREEGTHVSELLDATGMSETELFTAWSPWRYGGDHDDVDDDASLYEVTIYYQRMYYHEYKFLICFYEPYPGRDNDHFVPMGSVSVQFPKIYPPGI